MCLLYYSTILSSGYPALIYLLFAPLGTINLGPLEVYSNTPEPANCGGLFPLNITLVKLLQSAKARSPMLVTELGILIIVKLLQLEKADSPILVTELGMVTLFKLLQFEYLQPIITQYFIDNKSEIWLLFLIAHSKR